MAGGVSLFKIFPISVVVDQSRCSGIWSSWGFGLTRELWPLVVGSLATAEAVAVNCSFGASGGGFRNWPGLCCSWDALNRFATAPRETELRLRRQAQAVGATIPNKSVRPLRLHGSIAIN